MIVGNNCKVVKHSDGHHYIVITKGVYKDSILTEQMFKEIVLGVKTNRSSNSIKKFKCVKELINFFNDLEKTPSAYF